MVEELFANRISAFFGLDVVVSAIVLWVFIAFEGQRKGVRHTWAPIVASLAIGVSAGLPLFLFLRESAMEPSTRSDEELEHLRHPRHFRHLQVP